MSRKHEPGRKDASGLSKPCAFCHTLVYKSYYESLKNWYEQNKFCSKKCRYTHLSVSFKGGTPGSFSKEKFKDKTKHPRWKGGISKQAWYHLIYGRNYKLRKRGAKGSFTPFEWIALKEQYDSMCLCCKRKEPEVRLEADHVIPLAKGGTNYISNIQPLCRNCNAQKYLSQFDYRIAFKL